MQRRSSTCASATTTAAALLALVTWQSSALAQACCIAPGAAGLTRLAPGERALAGLDARAQTTLGTFDARGAFHRQPQGTRDLGLEQSLFAAARVLDRGQISATLPFVQTLRTTDAASANGGGVGDVRVALRWDLAYADDAWPWPGLALVAGVSAPTGRAPERAGDVLGAGATGAGTTQGWGGVALEQTSGPWLYGASATVTMRAPRDIGPVRSTLAPRFTMALIGAHAWRSGVALSLATAFDVEDRAEANGAVVVGSARRSLRFTTAVQVRLGTDARLVSTIYALPPMPAMTAGESSTLGLSVALVHPWS